MDEQAFAGQAEELGRRRNFTALKALLNEAPTSWTQPDAGRRVHIATAHMHREFGEWSKAAGQYREAQAHDPNDLWLTAERFIDRQRAAEFDWTQRNTVSADLDEELSQARADRRAPLLWARAMCDMGLHPDDLAPEVKLDRARAALDEADATGEQDDRLLVARARLAWIDTRPAVRKQPMPFDNAREIIDGCRSRALQAVRGGETQVRLDYAEARLRMSVGQWRPARALLQGIVDIDAGHQAAQVWLLYCDRLLSTNPRNLLDRIDHLLRPSLRYGDDELGIPEGRPAVVFAPHLESELLTERGAILEDADPEHAVNDYLHALTLRPRMPYATRRLMRTEATKNLDTAIDRGETAMIAAREAQTAGHAQLPADLMVDLGMVHNLSGSEEEAFKWFTEACQAAPRFFYPYEGLMMSYAQSGAREQALSTGREALELGMPRDAGIRIRMGQIYLEMERPEEALVEYEQALTTGDEAVDVVDRAQAGIVHARRTLGQLPEALADIADVDGEVGSRVLEAAGWTCCDLHDYGGALTYFGRALKMDPTAQSATFGEARALRLLGRPSAARACLESVRMLPRRDRPRLENELGWIALDLDEPEVALERFQQSLDLAPSQEPVHRGLIAASERLNRPWHEIEALATDAHTKLRGNSGRIAAAVGIARLARGELDKARASFDDAIKRVSGRRSQMLLRVIQINGFAEVDALADAVAAATDLERDLPEIADDPRVLLAKAKIDLAGHDPHGALTLYTRVLERWPRCVLALLGAATASLLLEDYANAERHLDLAIDACDSNVYALELKAWTLLHRHEAEHPDAACDSELLRSASELCDKARSLEPARRPPLECLAMLCALRGRLRTADIYLREAERHGWDPHNSWRYRGMLLLRMQSYSSAIDYLTDFMHTAGHDPTLRLMLGLAHLECGHTREGIAALQQAIALDPNNLTARLALASALKETGRPDEALVALPLDLAPLSDAHRVQLLLARVRALSALSEQSDPTECDVILDEALRHVSMAHSIRVDSALRADVEYHRGVVLQQRRQRRRALRALKRSKRLDPAHQDARRAFGLMRDSVIEDPNERYLRRWGNVAAVGLLLLLMLTVFGAWSHADGDPSQLDWSSFGWIIGALIVALFVAATLPRLVGVEFGRQVRLELRPGQPASEQATVSLTFVGHAPTASLLMMGFSPFRGSEYPDDVIGEL